MLNISARGYTPPLDKKHPYDFRPILDDVYYQRDPDAILYLEMMLIFPEFKLENTLWLTTWGSWLEIFQDKNCPEEMIFFVGQYHDLKGYSFSHLNNHLNLETEVYVSDSHMQSLIWLISQEKDIQTLQLIADLGLSPALALAMKIYILVHAHNEWINEGDRRIPDAEYYAIVSEMLSMHTTARETKVLLPHRNLLEQKLSRCILFYFDSVGIEMRLGRLKQHSNFASGDIWRFVRQSKFIATILMTNWSVYSSLREYCIVNQFQHVGEKCHNGKSKMDIWFIEEVWERKNLVTELRVKETGEVTLELTLLHYLGDNIQPKRALNVIKFKMITGDLSKSARAIFKRTKICYIGVVPVGHNAVFPLKNYRYRDWNVRISSSEKNNILGDKVFLEWNV